MKKIYKSLMIMLALVFLFAACAPLKTFVNSNDREEEDITRCPELSKKPEQPEEEGAVPEAEEEPQSAVWPTVDPDKKTYIPGNWNDDIYSNAHLGIEITKPANWTIASAEEREEMHQRFGVGEFSDSSSLLTEALNRKKTYDMVLYYPGRASIMLIVENLAMSLGGTSIDEDAYIRILAAQLDKHIEPDYEIGEVSAMTIGGAEYKSLAFTTPTEEPGVDDAYIYYIRRVDIHMACFLCAYSSGDEQIITDALANVRAIL